MATQVPPKKNAAHTFYIALASQASSHVMQANPTLATGDVKVAIDDGTPANLATLPVVDADFTKRVKVDLSAGEMNGDNVTIIFSDAAGAEWDDLVINLQTSARQIDDLAYPAVSGRSTAVDASGRVDANATQFAGQTITAAAGVTLPSSVASPTNITAGTITTVTNLTNAPTSGDLTATMKTSVTTAATAATPVAASVTGNVGGNVTGSVGSVVGAVGSVTGAVGSVAAGGIAAASFAAGALDAVWSVASRLLTAGTNIVLAKGTGVTGFNDLSAADVRTAVGLASANLDTQIGTLGTAANQTVINNNVLTRATPAQVNSEVLDVMNVDTFTEPGQGAPAATTTIFTKISHLYKALINEKRQTSSQYSLYNNAGAVVDQKAPVSDDGTTTTVGKVVSGP